MPVKLGVTEWLEVCVKELVTEGVLEDVRLLVFELVIVREGDWVPVGLIVPVRLGVVEGVTGIEAVFELVTVLEAVPVREEERVREGLIV